MKSLLKRIVVTSLCIAPALFGTCQEFSDGIFTFNLSESPNMGTIATLSKYTGSDKSSPAGSITVTIPNFANYEGTDYPITSIAEAAFFDHPEIGRVSFGQNINEIRGSAFKSCTGLKEISFPNELLYIGGMAFFNCPNLETVKFNIGLRQIDGMAFYGCSALKKLNLPGSIEKIGEGAFFNISFLETVVLNNATPLTLKDKIFNIYLGNTKLYVPVGSKKAYQDNGHPWIDFQSINEEPNILLYTNNMEQNNTDLTEPLPETISFALSPNRVVTKIIKNPLKR